MQSPVSFALFNDGFVSPSILTVGLQDVFSLSCCGECCLFWPYNYLLWVSCSSLWTVEGRLPAETEVRNTPGLAFPAAQDETLSACSPAIVSDDWQVFVYTPDLEHITHGPADWLQFTWLTAALQTGDCRPPVAAPSVSHQEGQPGIDVISSLSCYSGLK